MADYYLSMLKMLLASQTDNQDIVQQLLQLCVQCGVKQDEWLPLLKVEKGKYEMDLKVLVYTAKSNSLDADEAAGRATSGSRAGATNPLRLKFRVEASFGGTVVAPEEPLLRPKRRRQPKKREGKRSKL